MKDEVIKKIEHTTPDITQENIERLTELFPQVATEVRDEDGAVREAVDFDTLRDLLGGGIAEGQRERYQFTWPGKAKAKLEARRPCDKTMKPHPEKSVNWDTTQNIYIEGDNLEALKLMRETYAGKVKLIYIDHPYNTGHDFIYDDDFVQTYEEYDSQSGEYDGEGGRLVANPDSNGRFHSDWCSMMYPRLLLARDLLSDDGVIFISIDDNEQVNLRRICDEIFGESSMVTDGSAIICDFFSGSATTAHAVIQQNLEDGGYRKFLLVQLPESCSNDASAQKNGFSTICDIGEERIRRAGKKIVEEVEVANAQLKLGEDPKPVPDIGFRVFSIDSSNFLDTYSEPGEQTQASLLSLVDNLKEDRTPEDLLFQVLPTFRIPYSARVEKMDVAGATCFNVNDGQLIACFDMPVSTDAIEKIAQMKPIYAVFRDASFASDSDAANFEELFKTYSPDTVRRVI